MRTYRLNTKHFIWLFFIFIVGLLSTKSSHSQALLYNESYSDSTLFIGDLQFDTEIKLTQKEQQMGMMFRPSMQDNQAMIFPYASPRQVNFWMKNTIIPLDMLFFDDAGLLVEIKKNVQPCKTSKCPSYPSKSANIQLVLEINANLADKLEIEIGDKLSSWQIHKNL